jgi:hypothetical protein
MPAPHDLPFFFLDGYAFMHHRPHLTRGSLLRRISADPVTGGDMNKFPALFMDAGGVFGGVATRRARWMFSEPAPVQTFACPFEEVLSGVLRGFAALLARSMLDFSRALSLFHGGLFFTRRYRVVRFPPSNTFYEHFLRMPSANTF